MAKATLPKPVYAYVGVTDLAVEVVRDLVAETQTRFADVQKTATDPKALRDQAKTYRKAIETRVSELQAEALAYPGKVQTRVEDNVAVAADAYTGLVKRGESLVGRIRRQESTKATVTTAKTTVSKAKTTNTQAKKTSDTATTTARTAAKKATTAAKKTSTKPVAKKAAATTSSAKATVTTARKTASAATKAVSDATEKVGD